MKVLFKEAVGDHISSKPEYMPEYEVIECNVIQGVVSDKGVAYLHLYTSTGIARVPAKNFVMAI